MMNTYFASHHKALSQVRSEKLRFLLVLLFVFTLPFDRFYSTIALILLILCTFIDISFVKIKAIPKQIWIFQIIFFLALAGYGYSFNKHEAGFMLERQLAILAFPLILPMAIDFSHQKVKQVMIILTLSCLVSVIYLFANIFYIIIVGHLPLSYMFSKGFFNHDFSAPLGIHAGYLSLYVAFSIIFLVKQLVMRMMVWHKLIIIAGLGILLAGLFFLASRNTIIATSLVICFVFSLFYVKRKVLFFSIISIVLCAGLFSVSRIDYMSGRFSSDIITDIHSDASQYNFEGAEPRIERWRCALQLAANSPIIGYGTGDEIDMLKTKYVEKELFISYLESFNAHNQYLSYLLKNGIIGLLIFLGAFIYYSTIAIKARSYIYVSFLCLLLIGFFTENVLDANKGIYFFAFFNTFLGYTALKLKSPEPETR